MKSMTVGRLFKFLQNEIANGNERKPICVDKSTFKDDREGDGVIILDVCAARVEAVHLADDDGGGAYNKNGSERIRTCVVLVGSAAERGE